MAPRTTRRTMTKKPQQSATINVPAPDLLAHLELTFGWCEQQACEALGAYLMSTTAGRALRRELDACNQPSRAA
jgi:hypothetical protein